MKIQFLMFRLPSVLAIALSALSAQASSEGGAHGGGTGPVASYVACSGKLADGTKATFEVRATAAPTIVDSVLLTDSNQLIAHLYCEEGGSVASGAASAGKVLWNCGATDFDPKHDGNILVKVEQGGVTGVTTAEVTQEQMNPLEPAHLGSLLCN